MPLDPTQQFKLDLQMRERELAAKIAADEALDAYRYKHMELIEKGMLDYEASKFAQEYALSQAQFTFQREMGLRQITGAEQQAAFTQQMDTRRQDFEERWKNAELTGFVDGAPTEQRRQFDVNAVMNAPRGPADWYAYGNRLRGLQGTGALPGVIGNLVMGGQVARYSNGGQATPTPMTNTQMAMLATGQAQGSQYPGVQQYQTGQPGQPPVNYAAGAGGDPQQAAQMFGLSGRDVSYQQFRNLSPDEQQLTLGAASEGVGGFTPQSNQDFLQQMQAAAPNYQRSALGRMSGVG